jgi:hypothetical protein
VLGLFPTNSVSCAGSTCVSVGAHGIIGYSRDDGASWNFVSAAGQQTLDSVSCSSTTRCVAVGAAGTILVTQTGGLSWVQVASHTIQTLLGVACRASGPCIAVGDGGVVVSSANDEVTWSVDQRTQSPVGGQVTVLVAGDSFAHTLAQFVGRVSSTYGVGLIDGGLDGCNLARGDTISLPVSGPCAATGPGWPATYLQNVQRSRPKVSLLVLGPWDQSSRLIGGQWLSPGQPAFDSYYANQLRTAVDILSSEGGRVVVATSPYVRTTGPELCAPPPTTVPVCPTESERVDALDAVARQVAAAEPGRVTVLDLGQHLSPHDRFTSTVDGVVVRAADGVHLSEPGGEWLAPWLLPQLIAAGHSGA